MYCIVLSVLETAVQGERGRRPGHRGGVAQLGEHLLCKQGVIGSNPFISTTSRKGGWTKRLHGLIAQVVRAHA